MTDRAVGLKAARAVADVIAEIQKVEDDKATHAANCNARLKELRSQLSKMAADIRSGQIDLFGDV